MHRDVIVTPEWDTSTGVPDLREEEAIVEAPKGRKWDVNTGIPDLSGKVVIVTGANTPVGIGWHVAHQLAIHGAKVYVGARSEVKATDAIAAMTEASSGKSLNLQPLAMDLGDFKQVKGSADAFMSQEGRLDILVNNASVAPGPLEKDANGIPVSFVTNHLSPFLFTVELLPLIKKTAAAHPAVRVVTVSSSGHFMLGSGVKFSSIEDFNVELGGTDDTNSNLQQYALSKLANVLFTKELQKQFDRENVQAISLAVHPGIVSTKSAIKYIGGSNIAQLNPLTPLEGALTLLFAATNPVVWAEKENYKAQYLTPFGVVKTPSANAMDEELAAQLWDTSERVVREILAK